MSEKWAYPTPERRTVLTARQSGATLYIAQTGTVATRGALVSEGQCPFLLLNPLARASCAGEEVEKKGGGKRGQD